MAPQNTSSAKTISRRNFIKRCGWVTGSFASLNLLGQPGFALADVVGNVGFGPLIDDPYGIMRLPPGFEYTIVSRQGDLMTDGFYTPGKPDGMATFAGPGDLVTVVRNHELNDGDMHRGAFAYDNSLFSRLKPSQVYDTGYGESPALGGTTTFVYDTKRKKIVKDYLSLAGTVRNCAGGATPWGSWISCEETLVRKDALHEKDHGYCFEVGASTNGLAEPIPLKALGRFNHEAVAVDPKTGIVYLTEDDSEGLLYRFIPKIKGDLKQGGKLQALVHFEPSDLDIRNWGWQAAIRFKETLPVKWVDLDNVLSADEDLQQQGHYKGAVKFARGEGIWFGDNEFYVACTNGGAKKLGQIFRYTPSPYEGTKDELKAPAGLQLFYESSDSRILKSCDNLTVSPWGDLIVCEDHKHPFIVGITPEGMPYHFAENVGYQTEFTGATFSPDGSTLFVNIQGAGMTLVITGPFPGTAS